MRAPPACILLALALLPPMAAADPAAVPEGVPVPVEGDDGTTWAAAPGTYWLHVVAGPEGAVLDASGLSGTRGAQIPQTCVAVPQATPEAPPPDGCADAGRSHLGPTNAHGHTLAVREGSDAPRLALVEGTARAILGRSDLHHVDFQNGSYARIDARGDLAPGACVAQHVFGSAFRAGAADEVVLTGDVHVAAAGPGLRFALIDGRLRPGAEAADVLTWRGDLDRDGAPAFVQACAPEDAPGDLAYVVRVERWAAPEETAARAGVPAAGPGLALAALGAVAAALGRRLRRERGP